MCKMIYSTVVLIALVSLAGCGESADSLVQQQVDQLNELADALEAGAEQAEIDAIEERMKETKEASDGLNLSADEKKRLTEKYGEEEVKAAGRVMKAKMSKMGGAMQGMIEGMKGKMPAMPEGFGKMPQLP